MSTTTSVSPKVFPTRVVLVSGLIILLAVAVTTVFIWLYAEPVIAPPGLRLMNELWTRFVCQCCPL